MLNLYIGLGALTLLLWQSVSLCHRNSRYCRFTTILWVINSQIKFRVIDCRLSSYSLGYLVVVWYILGVLLTATRTNMEGMNVWRPDERQLQCGVSTLGLFFLFLF